MVKPSGTVTFLLADIVGSSHFWEMYSGDMGDLVVSLLEEWQQTIALFDGWTVKTLGDGVLAAFSTAPAALSCAVTLLDHCSKKTWPGGEPVEIRVGLNTDSVHETNDDYFGKAINRLSRILDLGKVGQVVTTASTRQLCAECAIEDYEFCFLGAKRLRGIPETLEVYAFQRIGSLPYGESARPEISAATLPDLSLEFVGRKAELRLLKKALANPSNRIVTVTGPGGIGKTRLAYEGALGFSPFAADGVFFVDCSTVDNEDGLAVACLEALSCAAQGSVQASLFKVLKDKSLLLVLDGFEHVVETAHFVARLVSSCQRVKVLVTSRIVLGLSSESELPLSPLKTAASASRSESFAMFVQVASRVSPGIRFDSKTITAIEDICSLVQGVPLLIRLAASRLRHMTLEELGDQLRTTVLELSSRDRDTPAKHANVRRVIADSLSLLADAPKQLLSQVGLFIGGFRMSDIQAVFGPDLRGDLKDSIEVLREHSLLQCDTKGDVVKYRLLDSIREYVSEDLNVSDDVRTRFLQHYSDLTKVIEKNLDEGRWKEGHELLVFAMGNMRRAIEFARNGDDPDALGRIGPPLAKVYLEAGLASDFAELSKVLKVQAEHAGDVELLLRILGLEGAYLAQTGRRHEARNVWRRRRDVATHACLHEIGVDATIDLAGMDITDKRWDDALAGLDLAEDLSNANAVKRFKSTIFAARAEVELGRGNDQEASSWASQAIEALDTTPFEDSMYVLRVAAEVAQHRSEWQRAIELWRSFLARAQSGHRLLVVRRGLSGLEACYSSTNDTNQLETVRIALTKVNATIDSGPSQPALKLNVVEQWTWQDLVNDFLSDS